MARRALYLCGGTQSSGSTLVSWCFLQRSDMDGMLDARPDLLPVMPEKLSAPLPWLKFTISCFRFQEVSAHLEAEGWDVRPLLIVRDVRAVFNSLIKKDYGRNGITSDDPPIRMRLWRFLEDWRLFRERGWPMLGYERFIADPYVLRQTCRDMGLPADEAMFSWPKPVNELADAHFGNQTFLLTRGQSLKETLRPSLASVDISNVPLEDLQWMERTFAEFNDAMGYPRHIAPEADKMLAGRAVPRFENTRSYDRQSRNVQRTQQAFAAATQHYQAGRPLQATSLCEQILTNKLDHLEALRLLAQIARDRGDVEPVHQFSRLETLRPGTAEYLNVFGMIHARLGRLETAAEAFRQAILLRPDFPEARQNLASMMKLSPVRPLVGEQPRRVSA